jgi:hypothetical protein
MASGIVYSYFIAIGVWFVTTEERTETISRFAKAGYTLEKHSSGDKEYWDLLRYKAPSREED